MTMQVTKRSALPLHVHQIWDAIGQISGAADLEKIVTLLTKEHELSREEITEELDYAVNDGLIIAEEDKEQKIYKLPSVNSFVKGDHDWYCFQCHLGGPVVLCEDCPRVFHLDCLPDDKKPQKDLFVCPPCHMKSTKPSTEKVTCKTKQLNLLLRYVCERFLEWQIDFMNHATGKLWAVATERSAKEGWRFEFLVYTPIDLNTMMEKANSGLYTSLEEFQVDCEQLVHIIGVYFGIEQVKGNQLGASFLRDSLHDIDEIKICHECFRRSNEKDHDWWFCLPCPEPHDVVWAKQSGYPFWPAKVIRKDGNRYDVRYFGGSYERGFIDKKNILPIETPISNLKVRRNAAWNEAFDELQKFLELAKNPDAVNDLPPRGKPKASHKRKSEVATPDGPVGKKSRASIKSSPNSVSATPKKLTGSNAMKKNSDVQSNGLNPKIVQPVAKKKILSKSPVSMVKKKSLDSREPTKSKGNVTSAILTSIGSGGLSNSSGGASDVKLGSSTATKDSNDSTKLPSNLRPTHDVDDNVEELDFINDASLDCEIYFSDQESNEGTDKIAEDAVSSSCNGDKKARNVYVQVNATPTLEDIKAKFQQHIKELKAKHRAKISAVKKQQWCYNCEEEAIYHCCWNTAYCTLECQAEHWSREHKRACRRKRPNLTSNTTASADAPSDQMEQPSTQMTAAMEENNIVFS